ncbi:MAG: hypothetical protein RQ745_05890 [Longimicrobiales bacterium]|nr:hypothetical protein [Longimicrobiales bacterium]
MTDLLEKAFREAAKLPVEAQDALASVLLAELEAERNWEERLATSQDALGRLADEALDEFREGSTRPLRTQPR